MCMHHWMHLAHGDMPTRAKTTLPKRHPIHVKCGTMDYIFGDADTVFQSCKILTRLPQRGQANTIIAQGRDAANKTGGFVSQFYTLATDNNLLHANFIVNTYLRRPWRKYSRVVFM